MERSLPGEGEEKEGSKEELKAERKDASDRGEEAVLRREEDVVRREEASSTWLHLERKPRSMEVEGGEQWLPALPVSETSFSCTCWLVHAFL